MGKILGLEKNVSISPSDFSIALLPTRPDADPNLRRAVSDAFDFWFSTWSSAFLELGTKLEAADEFSRQDEVLVLLYKNQVAATTFFRFGDLAHPIYRRDSYFSAWPAEAYEKLISKGSDGIICSYFTVGNDFRRQSLGVSIKDLLLGLLVERFMDSNRSVMTGTVRNNRGVNQCCFRFGATQILADQKLHGVDVDLLGFYRNSVHKSSDPLVQRLVDEIWSKFKYPNTGLAAA